MEWVRTHWGSVVAVGTGVIGYGALVRLDATEGTLRDRFTGQTVAWYLLAFAGFVVFLCWNERHPVDRRLLWLVPVGFRLMLLSTTPTLSDDVYRYLWDGHVATEGVNPYSFPLGASELDAIAIPARELANNPELGTPYLPAAQLVFAGSAWVLPSEPLAMQSVMLAFDLLTAVLIVMMLRRVHIADHRVAMYLWNPLVIVEIAHGAHIDALMVFLALAAVAATVAATEPRMRWLAPVTLALATMTRPLPALLLPVLWWRWSRVQRMAYALVSLALVVPFARGAGWGLFGESTGTGVFGTIRVYGERWNFNAGPHRWLESGLDRLGFADPGAVSRLVVIAAIVVIAGMVLRRARTVDELEALRLMAVPLAAFVLLSPTVHPWYMIVVVAWLPFLSPASDETGRRWVDLSPWLWLSGALALSYLTYRDPSEFRELDWVRRVEWYPTIGALALAAIAARVRTGSSAVAGGGIR